MARVRTDNVFGTTTDNPLTSGATTMNSAGLANLAAVSSKEAIIILDPNRLTGAPEIVVVTAHTGSATSATIQRGQFGTTARQHAQGTEWVHGPIAGNATTYATASDDQGDYVPMDGWESYTPTLTQSGAVTKTVTYAKYVRIGRTIMGSVILAVTGSGTASNAVAIGLPVASTAVVGNIPVGTGWIFDTSTPDTLIGEAYLATTTTVQLVSVRATGNILGTGGGFSAALANGDQINLFFIYEAAS